MERNTGDKGGYSAQGDVTWAHVVKERDICLKYLDETNLQAIVGKLKSSLPLLLELYDTYLRRQEETAMKLEQEVSRLERENSLLRGQVLEHSSMLVELQEAAVMLDRGTLTLPLRLLAKLQSFDAAATSGEQLNHTSDHQSQVEVRSPPQSPPGTQPATTGGESIGNDPQPLFHTSIDVQPTDGDEDSSHVPKIDVLAPQRENTELNWEALASSTAVRRRATNASRNQPIVIYPRRNTAGANSSSQVFNTLDTLDPSILTTTAEELPAVYKRRRKQSDLSFVCPMDQCMYRTSYKGHFERHIAEHGDKNVKMFKCDYGSCTYSTSRQGYLDNHKRARGHNSDEGDWNQIRINCPVDVEVGGKDEMKAASDDQQGSKSKEKEDENNKEVEEVKEEEQKEEEEKTEPEVDDVPDNRRSGEAKGKGGRKELLPKGRAMEEEEKSTKNVGKSSVRRSLRSQRGGGMEEPHSESNTGQAGTKGEEARTGRKRKKDVASI